jgi:UDP-N-acetyl-D-galactosamine dehydrogenase
MRREERMLSIEDFISGKERICIVGLGYVGLPLAALLARRFNVTGFDVDPLRIEELRAGFDRTGEVSGAELKAEGLRFTSDPEGISDARVIIVTVPTPVNDHKMPDLRFVREASNMVGRALRKGSLVVYESTVYPGVTEDICVPSLEEASGLKWKTGFHVGYSPERVNPGDRKHTIDKIVKVVAGDEPAMTEFLASLYGEIIEAGIHRAPNIKTAEAAKVIENIQRDLNIALANELALIFNRMGLDTREVLEAACTKWNFLRFEPGLVGGHCIGVDPYYLTFKAEELGYHPDVILAGRRTNDSMGKYVAEQTVKLLINAGKAVKGCKVLIMGFTFKENVPDVRNSKVADVVAELREYGAETYVYDPHVAGAEVLEEYGIELVQQVELHNPYDGIIFAVKHDAFKGLGFDFFRKVSNGRPILVDVKGAFEKDRAIREGMTYWRL